MTLNIITITIMITITNIILIIIISRYSCQLTFRQKWLDPRLAYSDMEGEVAGQGFLFLNNSFSLSGQLKYLTMTDPNKVWMPDTFFQVISIMT